MKKLAKKLFFFRNVLTIKQLNNNKTTFEKNFANIAFLLKNRLFVSMNVMDWCKSYGVCPISN